MYSPDLEKLIEAALIDGVLTDKKKQILFKKAEAFDIDLDEFEMVLDARLHEKQQSMKKNSEPPSLKSSFKSFLNSQITKLTSEIQPQKSYDNSDNSWEKANTTQTETQPTQSSKHGTIKKCPNCGAIVESFQIKCTDCNFEFRNVEASSLMKNLHNELQRIEDKLTAEKRGFFTVIEVEIIKAKTRFLSSYPIPNTKEDILEFLAMAISEGRVGQKISLFKDGAHFEYCKAWRDKAKQVIVKAKFAMKDDRNTMEEIEYYAKLLEKK